MIATSFKEWIAATQLYRQEWIDDRRVEGALADGVQAARTDALWKAAGKFRVARNFPKNNGYRSWVAQEIFKEAMPATPICYKDAVIGLAERCYDEAKHRNLRAQRTFSAMSKFLMLRFPDRGIVFDSRAHNALRVLDRAQIRSVLRCDNASRAKFERFICRWLAIAGPLVALLQQHGSYCNPIAASRIVDKFLWIRGGVDPAGEVARINEGKTEALVEHGSRVFEGGAAAGLFCDYY